MILDWREVEEGSTLDCDLCVIGGGAVGITLAHELAGTDLSVCLLESGGLELDSETQELYDGVRAGMAYPPLHQTRLRFLGGTTNHWAGQSRPLDPYDFASRGWVPESGWPMGYTVLTRYLGRAQELCGLGPLPFEWGHWGGVEELPDFPMDPQHFRPVVFRYPAPVLRFGRAYRHALERARNIRCFLHANVLELECDEGETAVQRVRATSLDGHRAWVRPRATVLAAGAIENVRLLLVSGASGAGLGNRKDMVGRYFMEHAFYDHGKAVLDPSQGLDFFLDPWTETDAWRIRTDFQLTPEWQERMGVLNHSVHLRIRERESHVPGPEILGRAWNRLEDVMAGVLPGDGEPFDIRIRLEHAPNRESRVTLADRKNALGQPHARLRLAFGELEGRTVRTVLERLALEMGRAELGRVHLSFDPQDRSWTDELGWQSHHCGGTRMGNDPTDSVVDPSLRVHEVSNLYVCGSSVFPTSGHTNPTLNLVALAVRLADHLEETLA